MKKIKGLYRLTFSQREGKAPLPEPMRLEHVSKDFRNLVWLAIYKIIREESIHDNLYNKEASMLHIVPDYTVKALSDPHDHINDKPSDHTPRKL